MQFLPTFSCHKICTCKNGDSCISGCKVIFSLRSNGNLELFQQARVMLLENGCNQTCTFPMSTATEISATVALCGGAVGNPEGLHCRSYNVGLPEL